MTAILNNIGTFIATTDAQSGTITGGAVYWVGQWVRTISNNPILFLFAAAIPIAGFGIGALRRLININ